MTSKQSIPMAVTADSAIIIVAPGYWGKGRTLADAYKALTEHSGTLKPQTKLQVFITDSDGYVSSNGYVTGNRCDDCGLFSIEQLRRSLRTPKPA